jgi:hypothetical protein
MGIAIHFALEVSSRRKPLCGPDWFLQIRITRMVAIAKVIMPRRMDT